MPTSHVGELDVGPVVNQWRRRVGECEHRSVGIVPTVLTAQTINDEFDASDEVNK